MKPNEEHAARIFLVHRDFVKSQTYRYAPMPGLSEDIFQEVFIEFVSKSSQWNLDDDVRPLLLYLTKRIASRTVADRRKNLPNSLSRVVEQLCQSAEMKQSFIVDHEEFTYAEEKQVLQHCINLLPNRSRTLIDLYYFDGVPSERIAESMRMSLNAVYLAMHRIRERLKRCIRRSLGWRDAK